MKLNKKEILRKSWHILWGLLLYFILKSFGLIYLKYLIGIILIIGIFFYIIDSKGIRFSLVELFISKLARKGERIEGSFLYLIGIFIISLFFNQKIVGISILILGFSDGLATIVGVHCKKKIYKKKTYGGTIAFFITTFFIITLFYNPIYGFISALILTPIELFTTIDDNLVIPIACSFIILILVSLL